MRSLSLPLTISIVTEIFISAGCGARGNPVPKQQHPPAPCTVRAKNLRTLEVTLPTTDTHGNPLLGIEAIRVYYLSMGTNFPSALEVFQHGKAIFECRRPEIPPPGKMITLDLSNCGHSTGWLVVVPFRIGNIAGVPSQVLPWVDPFF
jgi:hypothetical protein